MPAVVAPSVRTQSRPTITTYCIIACCASPQALPLASLHRVLYLFEAQVEHLGVLALLLIDAAQQHLNAGGNCGTWWLGEPHGRIESWLCAMHLHRVVVHTFGGPHDGEVGTSIKQDLNDLRV